MVLWVTEALPLAVTALLGAAICVLLQVAITWQEAVQVDWGVVLLYGGGFALGVLSFQTGLAEAMGRGLTGLLPIEGSFGMLVVISIAHAAGLDPLEPALGATMAASLGFMLPVSTPCNAIVYGSGYVPLSRMIRHGLALDLAGIVVIVIMVRLLSPLLR